MAEDLPLDPFRYVPNDDGSVSIIIDFKPVIQIVEDRAKKAEKNARETYQEPGKPELTVEELLELDGGMLQKARDTVEGLKLLEKSYGPEGINRKERGTLRDFLGTSFLDNNLPDEGISNDMLHDHLAPNDKWFNTRPQTAIDVLQNNAIAELEPTLKGYKFFVSTEGGNIEGSKGTKGIILFSDKVEYPETKIDLRSKPLGDAVDLVDKLTIENVDYNPALARNLSGDKPWLEMSAEQKETSLDGFKKDFRAAAESFASKTFEAQKTGYNDTITAKQLDRELVALRDTIREIENPVLGNIPGLRVLEELTGKTLTDGEITKSLPSSMAKTQFSLVDFEDVTYVDGDKARELFWVENTDAMREQPRDYLLTRDQGRSTAAPSKQGAKLVARSEDEQMEVDDLIDKTTESGLLFHSYSFIADNKNISIDPLAKGEMYVALHLQREVLLPNSNAPEGVVGDFAKAIGVPVLMGTDINVGEFPMEGTDIALIRVNDLKNIPPERLKAAVPIIAAYVDDGKSGRFSSRSHAFEEASQGVERLNEIFVSTEFRRTTSDMIVLTDVPILDYENMQIVSGKIDSPVLVKQRLNLLRNYVDDNPAFAAKADEYLKEMMEDVAPENKKIAMDGKTPSTLKALDALIADFDKQQKSSDGKTPLQLESKASQVIVPIISIMHVVAKEEIEALGQKAQKDIAAAKAEQDKQNEGKAPEAMGGTIARPPEAKEPQGKEPEPKAEGKQGDDASKAADPMGKSLSQFSEWKKNPTPSGGSIESIPNLVAGKNLGQGSGIA